ncbi:MAG: endolytic transglycosylase MltG [Anaerolineae bacterium]|nr:endolytic transglycosylase MltG [Anaerolineae bacterium]RIK24207.1 MAG: endolytic transglycosylase MltG [Anaerolineae bacterium]
MTNNRPNENQTPFGFLWRFIVIVVILGLGAAAGFVFYRTWLGDGVERSRVNPSLSNSQRLYLEYYLSQHAAGLEQPAGTAVGNQTFTITPGEGAAAIAENLRAVGLLADTELFLNYLTYYGLDGGLVAGEYTLDPQQTIPQLAESLGSGGARALQLNFLPGWRSEEMGNYLRVVSPAQIDADEFLAIAQNPRAINLGGYNFLASLPDGASLEGYLFPDAYAIEPATDSAALVGMMLANFDRQVTPAMRQAYGALGLSLRDALILASIVEKEAALAEEKPLMAAVFLNRLRNGMRLQADPTVQYALGYNAAADSWWKSPLDAADLTVASPYNTYQVDGLPPGPIANPGLTSLQAIANPAAVDYLFFVLDCTAATPGQHIFSVTYEEHLANVERCR